MPHPRIVASLALLASIGSGAFPSGEPEPPLRARVRIGDEVLEPDVGAEVRTADGRPVVVELLPTRTFTRPGAFAFDYPRDWSFVGAAGSPSPADGWWSLTGDGTLVHVRRHDEDPREVVERTVAGLASLPAAETSPAEVTLQDRTLAGRAVEYDMGGIPGPVRRWRQEVYGWRQADGTSWLLAFQRESDSARLELDALLRSWRWM